MSVLEEILSASKQLPVPKQVEGAPFAEGFWPWVAVGRRHLKKKAGRLLRHLQPEAVFLLERALFYRFVEVSSPSFAMELGIARLHGSLKGKSARGRYLDFMRKTFWERNGLTQFFEEYAEIARLLVILLDLWVNQAVEFLERLDRDLPLLAKTFNKGKSLGLLASLSPGEGDTHQDGRSVYHLKFASGKELFYKPKDLSFAIAFHKLLEQVRLWGLSPDLKGYTVLPRKGYGWEEKVAHAPCKSRQEVVRYFERSGMLLALLYLFDGTDVHFENLIASGEYPVLIDLETFFHANLSHPDKQQTDEVVGHSVLATALLPSFMEKPNGERIDISGLSGEQTSYMAGTWKNLGTDEMMLIFEKREASTTSHRVFLEGAIQEPHHFVKEIMCGFRKMYECVQKRRSFFLKKGGWLDEAALCPMRLVLRATRLYSYILERFTSPPILLNKDEREKEMKILSKYWIEPGREHLVTIIKDEKRALAQRDVPFFNSYPKKRHLYSGNRLVLKNCLDGDSYSRVFSRISQMSEEDCKMQETFIHHSFYGKETAIHSEKGGKETEALIGPLKKLSSKDLIREAEKIGEDLLQRAYRSQGGALGWIALEPKIEYERFELQPLSENLYGGKIGVALFFAALHLFTKEKKWKKAALDTLKNLREMVAKKMPERLVIATGIGGMGGSGSCIYGLCKIGELLDEPSLIKDAQKIALAIEDRRIENDKVFDVIGGSAGLILALLPLWEKTKDARVLKIAERAARHLCENSKVEGRGIAWQSYEGISHLGFSHGVAGIVHALTKLAAHTNKAEILNVVKKALKFERSHFCQEEKNWPRLSKDKEPSFQSSWCHGATGIGFSRVSLLSHHRDRGCLKEIEIAVQKTHDSLHGAHTLCLCCGSFGGLEFLREVAFKLPQVVRKEKLHEIAASLLARYKKTASQKGEAHGIFHPGFMQGISGIGYTLLRLADSKNTLPQVLLLD